MSAPRKDIRAALYEAPGPKAKKRIAIATAAALVALAALIVLVIRQLYITGQFSAKYWSFFARGTTWSFLGRGLLGTLEAALAAGVMTFLMGFVLMLGRIGNVKPLQWLCTVLIEFSRGVPTLLYIYFFTLVLPQLGVKLPAFWKIALPVAISAAGVVAEQLRSGVNAVPRGQREAGISIGMRDGQIFRMIIFPQAFRYVIPALISELVIVLKDTTFAYVVNYADLMQNAKVLISNYDSLLSVYFVVAVIYILINCALNHLAVVVARRGNHSAAIAP